MGSNINEALVLQVLEQHGPQPYLLLVAWALDAFETNEGRRFDNANGEHYYPEEEAEKIAEIKRVIQRLVGRGRVVANHGTYSIAIVAGRKMKRTAKNMKVKRRASTKRHVKKSYKNKRR